MNTEFAHDAMSCLLNTDTLDLLRLICKLNVEDRQDICKLILSLDNDKENFESACSTFVEILFSKPGCILPLLSVEEMKLERTRLQEIETKYSTEDGPTDAEYKEAQELVKKVYYCSVHEFDNGFWLRDDLEIRRGVFEIEQAYSLFYKSPTDGSRRVQVYAGPLDWAIEQANIWIKENPNPDNCCPQ